MVRKRVTSSKNFAPGGSFVILRSVMVCSPFLVWFLVASAGATLAPAESGLRKRHGGSASGPGHPRADKHEVVEAGPAALAVSCLHFSGHHPIGPRGRAHPAAAP
jgi:hypothetical protein